MISYKALYWKFLTQKWLFDVSKFGASKLEVSTKLLLESYYELKNKSGLKQTLESKVSALKKARQ